MAERAAAKSTSPNQKGGAINRRRCYYCDQEGHIARECPKKERDRLEKLTCFGCGGSGHMKRDCPEIKIRNSAKSPSVNQQPKYSRSLNSPSGTSRPNAVVASPKCNNRGGDDHVWGKGYRLGSASDGEASKVVRSYSSVAGNTDSTSKSIGNPTDKEINLSESISDDRTDINEKVNQSRQALGKTHCSQKMTNQQPSEVAPPLRDDQSDPSINGAHGYQQSNDSPETAENCSTCTNEKAQHTKCASSSKEEPSSAAVKESSKKKVPEKRKQSHFPPFIDTHCHLDYVFDRYHHHGTFKDFADRLSYPTNFEGCISTFCDPAAFSSLGAWRELLSEPNVWGTFGIHPHNAKYYHTNGLEDKVLEGLQHPRCVAFGEIGLDYSDHSPSNPQIQKDILRHQLQLVVPFGKPVVLHCRDAEQDLFEILTQHLPRDWLIHLHCFTGEPHIATQFLNEFPNLYLGVCGNVTNPRQTNMRTVVCETALERLLIETDAPYHVPSNLPKAGWCRNTHPALGFYVAKEIAKLRKEDLVDVLKTIRTNTQTLYGV